MKSQLAEPVPPYAETANHAPSTKSGRLAMLSLALAMLLSALGTSIATVGLPSLAVAFHASFQQVQWVVLAYLLAITGVIVSVGRLSDVIGRRRLLLAGIALFTLASALCGVASTLWLLIGARAMQGVGAAVMMVLSMALVADSASKEKTGSAIGLLGSMAAIGTALGPSLGGLLIASFGWRAIFFVKLPLGLLSLLLAYKALTRDQARLKTGNTGFDHLGTLLLILTLSAYALAMTMGRASFGPISLVLLSIAVIGLGLFIMREQRATSPLIRLALFRDPIISAGLVMSSLVTTVVMATLVIGPFYLSGALGLDASAMGMAMSCGPIVAALAGVPAGRGVDRFGAPAMMVAGLVSMCGGCAAMVALPTSLGVPAYLAPLAFITAGYAFFQAANNTAVITHSRAEYRGLISGLLNLSRNLGLITGTSLMGTVFAASAASSNVMTAGPEALVRGMRISFLLSVALILIALSIHCICQALARKAYSANT
ncbi:MFS transporter [Undibacterium sp. Ren11W]|uniref:MFS transporter n=1 Tax=Undibacterium sp. Ren11W TaxID=3413045 RepID=UPI003BF21423